MSSAQSRQEVCARSKDWKEGRQKTCTDKAAGRKEEDETDGG